MAIKRKKIQKEKNNTESSQKLMRLLPPTNRITHPEKLTMQQFPIVGIGASAGGLAAFEAFFTGMPATTDPHMAFVLVQHLASDHKSILSGLIQRYTRMQVFEVQEGMQVKPNCVYVIPPGRDMAFRDGKLRLTEPSAHRGHRLPIDFFFSSLAKDQHERAIGIVLSGTGSDGTLGIREIKGEGGIAMAQSPDSAEYGGMPKCAIATGLVDFVLSPADMPAQLMTYVTQAFNLPSKHSSQTPMAASISRKYIFNMLLKETRHDFSLYKPSTINCRIERRVALLQLGTIDEYVKYLRQTPAEAEALFHDLLIGATRFFRDPHLFRTLEKKIIPKIFADRSAGETIRVWTQGCSTGEEAYSIAILLQEYLNTLNTINTIQIFATDIDKRAIATAREGLYPASIAADVSAERLSNFFTIGPDNTTYRIHEGIRDMVIFSKHDVIKDPPFSKLDLISCRNLLIYMTTDLQNKIFSLFHYGLKPGGFLFLGASESAGKFTDMFVPLDKKSRLYQRRQGVYSIHRSLLNRTFSTTTPANALQLHQVGEKAGFGKLSLRELTERTLLQQVAPTGALVNSQGDILYLHGRTGMYLEPTPGDISVNNILEMARDGLRYELASVLHEVTTSKETLKRTGLRVSSNGAFIVVNLTIRPVVTGPGTLNEAPLYLVILEEVPQTSRQAINDAGSGSPPELDASVYIASLRQELRTKEQYLQTANEELKSSMEEMQSINEELQSTNEELETSKEELQSVNEELAAVNAELQANVDDLTRTNSDMNNMVAGTGIGTVFVDHQLHILRFTPDTTRIINLIPADVGRPVGHIVSNLKDYDSLIADIQAVLDTLVPKEADVQTQEGKWYTMRIQPYRNTDNVIEGAVISFINITKRKRAEDWLQKALDELRILRGIVPMCTNCKQTRDDKGFWSQVEDYVQNYTEAIFRESLCPDCLKQLDSELEETQIGPATAGNGS